MSLLHALADRVVTVRADLPLAEVGLASGRLREATVLLAATLEASSAPSAAPLLASAASHLDAAAGALGRAGDELDRYLASVGLVAPVPAPTAVVVSGGCAWADRVDVLTRCCGVARPPVDPRLSLDVVLVEAVRAASARERVALRRSLVAAPPAVGWALGARTAALLGVAPSDRVRRRALDLSPVPLPGVPGVDRAGRGATGRLPTLLTGLPATDGSALVDRARRGALGRLPALLPGLAAAEGAALVDRALRLSAAEVSAGPADPADAGVVGVVLVSVVLGLTGAAVESLVAGEA